MKTNTIDQRIRSKATKELEGILNIALRDFCKAIEILGTTDVVKIDVLDDKNKMVEARAYNMDVLKSIKEAAFKKLSVKYEEKAISDFLNKVDSLSGQVDDLYNQIN